MGIEMPFPLGNSHLFLLLPEAVGTGGSQDVKRYGKYWKSPKKEGKNEESCWRLTHKSVRSF